jgi:hypothetical protein
VAAALAVADANSAEIESTVLRWGTSRRYLAPIAWAAGTLVLVVRGAGLLLSNWRLTLIELIPAAWIWLVMWDLRRHGLRATPLQTVTPAQLALAFAITIAASTAAFWCNAVFGFAIGQPRPRIRPAIRDARPYLGRLVAWGTGVGVLLTAGLIAIPRIESWWLYVAAVLALYGLMLVTLVVVPARILGIGKRRLRPREAIGRWMTSGALSAVAMTPGFVLDRVGLLLLGTPDLHLVGLFLLTLGAGLYAAGLSSVKAIKLTMRLETRG